MSVTLSRTVLCRSSWLVDLVVEWLMEKDICEVIILHFMEESIGPFLHFEFLVNIYWMLLIYITNLAGWRIPSHYYTVVDFIDCTVGCVNGLEVGEMGKRYQMTSIHCCKNIITVRSPQIRGLVMLACKWL